MSSSEQQGRGATNGMLNMAISMWAPSLEWQAGNTKEMCAVVSLNGPLTAWNVRLR